METPSYLDDQLVKQFRRSRSRVARDIRCKSLSLYGMEKNSTVASIWSLTVRSKTPTARCRSSGRTERVKSRILRMNATVSDSSEDDSDCLDLLEFRRRKGNESVDLESEMSSMSSVEEALYSFSWLKQREKEDDCEDSALFSLKEEVHASGDLDMISPRFKIRAILKEENDLLDEF